MLRTVGKNVLELRAQRNLGLRELARLAKLSPTQLGKIEEGRSAPTEDTIRALAAALRVAPSVLFGEEAPLCLSTTAEDFIAVYDALRQDAPRLAAELAYVIAGIYLRETKTSAARDYGQQAVDLLRAESMQTQEDAAPRLPFLVAGVSMPNLIDDQVVLSHFQRAGLDVS